MALTPRLDLRQTQSLVMTPQLQQAIKLLQFSSIELQAFVDGQLLENPLLERDETAPDTYGIADGSESAVDATQAQGEQAHGEQAAVDVAVRDDPAAADGDLDTDIYDNLFDVETGDDSFAGTRSSADLRGDRSGSFETYDTSAEDLLPTQTTLQAHLLSQLSVAVSDPTDRIIAVHLIDMLDESGYLVGELAELAELLGCDESRIEATLQRVQDFDPAGIFARSLRECLALQLADRGLLDDSMARLLDHLDLVGRRDWAVLARHCGLGSEQLAARVALLRSLNPKPALAFDYALPQTVIPDVLMRQHPAGGWIVELNPDTLPRVLVNNSYYTQISRHARKREDRQYIQECMQSANWLVKSLHQRATTILKVATEIIRQQQGFFVSGVQALRPLILRDIAEAISMHESTVSRVTSNKFVATPRGIYELKYFFTHAVGGSRGGDSHSAEFVRHRVRTLIDAEAAGNVLSDDAVAEILQKEGIDIARRTVAKYREAMGISSSVQRRREKGDAL
jgi:RNA polymerase sigma-54 factor